MKPLSLKHEGFSILHNNLNGKKNLKERKIRASVSLNHFAVYLRLTL